MYATRRAGTALSKLPRVETGIYRADAVLQRGKSHLQVWENYTLEHSPNSNWLLFLLVSRSATEVSRQYKQVFVYSALAPHVDAPD